MWKNRLIRKIGLISKFITSSPEKNKKTIALHTLPNISRNKGNQTTIFGQLVECNTKNILILKNHTQNGVDKLFPKPFLKVQS